jgi:hypothetical protein
VSVDMGCGTSSTQQAQAPAPKLAPTILESAEPTLVTESRPKPTSRFQIQLSGQWKDYCDEEDRILKRAYMSGFPNAKFRHRGQSYEYSFKKMMQTNLDTGKERTIRQPLKMKAPSKPLVPEGPSMVIKVRPGQAGKKIHVPHPKDKSFDITIVVPKNAQTGQEMLVPVPDLVTAGTVDTATGKKGTKSSGWTTGGKVAAGATAVGAAGMVVAGAILYTDPAAQEWVTDTAADAVDAAAPHVEATGEWLETAAADVGEWTEEAAKDIAEWVPEVVDDAGDWVVEAGDSAGAFIMNLF